MYRGKDKNQNDSYYGQHKNKNKLPKNYHFHTFGAGGVDGSVQLNDYDWGQVSMMRLPMDYILCKRDEKTGVVDVKKDPCDTIYLNNMQGRKYNQFQLPVRTLSTIMKALGHTKLAVLKMDVRAISHCCMRIVF